MSLSSLIGYPLLTYMFIGVTKSPLTAPLRCTIEKGVPTTAHHILNRVQFDAITNSIIEKILEVSLINTSQRRQMRFLVGHCQVPHCDLNESDSLNQWMILFWPLDIKRSLDQALVFKIH